MRWAFIIVVLIQISSVEAASLEDSRADFLRPATIPSPGYNPTTLEKVELGRTLFFDKRLSGANDVSCASCHQPGAGFEDKVPLSVGTEGAAQKRHTPTLFNLAWGPHFAWDGRVPTLEAFVISPIQGMSEMGQNLDTLMAELEGPELNALFDAAFPTTERSIDQVALSVASYVRTLTSPITAFDRWVAGDEGAVTVREKAGFDLFMGKAGCGNCHSGWRFTNDAFYDTGVATVDQGRAKVTGQADTDRFAFKTPTLRGIKSRAPYMHDGSLPNLEAVIDHYQTGGSNRRHHVRDITSLSLSSDEKLHLKAFLGIL